MIDLVKELESISYDMNGCMRQWLESIINDIKDKQITISKPDQVVLVLEKEDPSIERCLRANGDCHYCDVAECWVTEAISQLRQQLEGDEVEDG